MLSRPGEASAQTTTAEATVGTFETTVTASGTIAPSKQADLDFDVSGRVTKVAVEPGDTVAADDVLATLDTASLDASLASAQAQLDAAETAAADDGSESSVQRASNDAAVASAEAGLAEAEENLDAATLRATFGGTVAAVSIEVGDQTGSGTSSSGGGQAATGETTTTSAAVSVITPTSFVVEAEVAADDIAQVKDGLQVTVTPSGADAEIFGTVAEVGRVATASTSGAATFPVTVKITGEQEGLYAGTSADIAIVVKQVQDVLTVPTQAVDQRGRGDLRRHD